MSASVSDKSLPLPTAVQLFAAGHVMPANAPKLGAAIGVIDQLVPFQCSASVWVSTSSSTKPTALQSVEVAHDTPSSRLGAEPTLGTFTIAHVDPFQRSANTVIVEPSCGCLK